jgi:tripartite-type tricarboxylate transporter receptor subunit TctC
MSFIRIDAPESACRLRNESPSTGSTRTALRRCLAVRPRSLRQFVHYLKQNGNRVKQAHGGIGASSHMACLLFNAQAGVKPSLVAYRGTGPALNDLIDGHVDFLCEQVVSVAPQIAAGAVKAYAIFCGERLPTLSDVPTAKEAGLDYQMSIWAGMFAPKGTSKAIVDKLAVALDKSLDDPAVKTKVAELGGSIPPKSERTPAKFSRFVNSEILRWSPVLSAAFGRHVRSRSKLT